MNWYKLADLVDMLNNLGVDPQVQQFISTLPNDQKQHYVNQIRRNPGMTMQDMQQFQMPQQMIDPYLPHEKEMAQRFDPRAQRWILVQLKQARQSNLDVSEQDLLTRPSQPSGEGVTYNDRIKWEGEANRYESYRDLWSSLDYWRRTNGLNDVLRAYPNLDISSYSPEDLDDLIHEWHAVQAGEGSGSMYQPTQPDLVAYGPQWENKEYNGWTIQEVRGKNDLAVEGNRMNHCVGSYCDYVDAGDVRIFSLRDPKNEPHITIETSPDMSEFKQVMGNSNSEPDEEYKPMIREWIMSLRAQGLDPSYDSEEDLEDMEQMQEFLASIGENYDDMGFSKHNFRTQRKDYKATYRWDEIIQSILDMNESSQRYSRNGVEYWGDITEMPEVLVNAAITADEKNNDPAYTNLYTMMEESNEKADEIMEKHWEWLDYHDYYTELPDPDDYEEGEMDEEYKKDYAEAEEMRQKEVDEAHDEFFRKIPETGLNRDIHDAVRSAERRGIIPDSSTIYQKQKEKAATNWYSMIK